MDLKDLLCIIWGHKYDSWELSTDSKGKVINFHCARCQKKIGSKDVNELNDKEWAAVKGLFEQP